MKKFAFAILFAVLFSASSVYATTWYAQDGAGAMSTRTWNDAAGGGGNALTWANRLAGDVFVANAQTGIDIDTDPGLGAGQNVTISTATSGGGFTYATATNLTMNMNVQGGTSICLSITGSTGGGTIVGTVTGGSVNLCHGVSDTHTVVTINIIGNITGGGNGAARGYYTTGAASIVAITGNAIAATASGIENSGTGGWTITGNCLGHDTTANAGCFASGSGGITVTGNIVNGKRGSGATGAIYFTPAATNYVLYPKNTSYSLGTVNANATEMPADPGVVNVLTGTTYGTFTGTLSASGVAGTYAY